MDVSKQYLAILQTYPKLVNLEPKFPSILPFLAMYSWHLNYIQELWSSMQYINS